MLDLPADRFEQLVADALDSIPDELAALMDNVAVFVEDQGDDPDLFGLYEGIPLTERGDYGGLVLPDRITIFREPILRRCSSERDVVEQVRVTVIHEVGHHFGLDEERLEELGWA
ncbi:MAG: metallopeptidase family protein [Acidimicrobiales bacterium]|nr:metallopeptidase family protein [Acidimicrobiales bacterium]